MQYTVRAFVEGRDDRLDTICRTFCSMERTAYNLLRDSAKAGAIEAVLRGSYRVKNARWCRFAINQASAVIASQEEGISYRIEQCREKVRTTGEKIEHLRSPLKLEGQQAPACCVRHGEEGTWAWRSACPGLPSRDKEGNDDVVSAERALQTSMSVSGYLPLIRKIMSLACSHRALLNRCKVHNRLPKRRHERQPAEVDGPPIGDRVVQDAHV